MLKLAVVHRGAVSVILPGGFTLPLLAAGDELELLVSVGGDGSFTLVSLENETADDEDDGDHDEAEDEDDDDGVDLHDDDDGVEVKGTFLGVVEGVVSVRPGNGASAVQCNLNGGVVPAGITVGDFVEMECSLVGGKLVVHELEEEDEADDETEVKDEIEDHDESESDDDDEHEGNSGPGDSGDEEEEEEEEHSGESDD
jgi:hypothetical protein